MNSPARRIPILLITALWVGLTGCQPDGAPPGTPAFSEAEMRAYEQQAARGESEAEFMLGLVSQQGLGKPVDPLKAVEWFTRAGNRGHARAQVALGVMLRSGDGVPADAPKAAEWFLKAAQLDSREAQFYLAEMSRDGQGMPKDPVQALMWFQLADHGARHIKEASIAANALKPSMTRDQIDEATRRAAAFRPATNAPAPR